MTVFVPRKKQKAVQQALRLQSVRVAAAGPDGRQRPPTGCCTSPDPTKNTIYVEKNKEMMYDMVTNKYSVCNCAKAPGRKRTEGIRMKFPGYPNNREADERASGHCDKREGAL